MERRTDFMTVQSLITSITSKLPNTLTNQDYVDFVNDLESAVYSDTIKEFISTFIPLYANTAQYTFPTGVTLQDIESVFVNGVEYDKIDLRQKITGYYLEGGKLTLRPTPSQTDDSYVSGAGEITFASGSITTTGDDFSGFSVGDTVLVSGATTSANNKYAVITAVAAKVLSFQTGTFSAGADAAAVTVWLPSLEIVSRYKPATKLLANIDTDTLLLPDADIYRYCIYAKICELREKFDVANNYKIAFNSKMSDFKIKYENSRPKKKTKRWSL
jgi:hypothetical protein